MTGRIHRLVQVQNAIQQVGLKTAAVESERTKYNGLTKINLENPKGTMKTAAKHILPQGIIGISRRAVWLTGGCNKARTSKGLVRGEQPNGSGV